MKIIHIVRQFYPMIGGIENYVLMLALEQKKEHEITVLTLNRNFMDDSMLPEREIYQGIQIIRVPFHGSRRYPLAFSAYGHIKEYDFIHIHAVDFFIDYFAFTRLFHRKKIVLTTHGGFFHTPKFRILKKIFFQVVTRYSLSQCYSIIACGENDFALFQKLSRKTVKIDNGVNVKDYLLQPKNIHPGELLYVGRIDTHKRIDLLIRVTKMLRDSGQNVHLRVIGPDWNHLKEDLLKLAVELNIEQHVIFEGAVSDTVLSKAYETCQLFLSASAYEGFGLSAVEALASGSLAVVHINDSFKTLFHNLPFVSMADFEDIHSTVEKIKIVLHYSPENCLTLEKQARLFAGNYSWESVAKIIGSQYPTELTDKNE